MTIEELSVRVTEADDRSKSNKHRIDDLEKRQDAFDDLVKSVAVFAKEQEHIQADVKEIKADVRALTEKPGKRWDGLLDKLIYAAVGAFLAWLMAGGPGV